MSHSIGDEASLDTCGIPVPLLVDRPLSDGPGGLLVHIPGRAPIALMSDNKPVRQFNPGWRADSLFTLLDPLWFLILRHDNGEIAWWHIESNGHLTQPPGERPPREKRLFAARIREIAVWLSMTHDAPIRIALPDTVLAYLQLPRPLKESLDRLLPAPVRRTETGVPPGPTPPPPGIEAVSGTTGFQLGQRGAMVPLTMGGKPATLNQGWHVAGLELYFAPILTITLEKETGDRAAWFADLHGRVIANHPDHLPQELKHHLVSRGSPALDRLWNRIVLGREGADGPSLAGPAASIPVAHLGGLVPAWMEMHGRDHDTRLWVLDEALPPGLGYVVPTGSGLRSFETEPMRRTLSHPLRAEVDRLLQTGGMQWPSPADGEMVESDGFALLLHEDCFAYRFNQKSIGLSFFVICSGGFFRNYGIYLPAAELLVLGTRQLGGDFVRIGRFGDTMLRHVCQFAASLEAGRTRDASGEVQLVYGACAIHIGHYVWQDLSGLAIMLRDGLPPGRVPRLQVFEQGRLKQFFGPEEDIFPVLAGRIERHDGPFMPHVDRFYSGRHPVVKYTAINVPASLRMSMQRAAEQRPDLQATRRDADAARRSTAPVILLGIRVGNRTLVDLPDFMTALVERLGHVFPGCTVILDGLNDVMDRGSSVPVPDNSDLAQEFAIARSLADACARTGVGFIDNINRSALRSVLLCSRADVFIAPLGAALSKYRWLCNTPGLVLSSRWNLEHRDDLHIYDSPSALEGSSEMQFNALADVVDAEAAPNPSFTDFVVNRASVFAQFETLVRHTLSMRDTGSKN